MDVPLQPADIIFTRENTLASWLIRIAQGDCDWSHVCLADGNGNIHTTGAKRFAWYGHVNAGHYLHNKSFAIGRYNGLTDKQAQAVLDQSHQLFGNFYPFWKVLQLAILGLQGKKIKQVGRANTHVPRNTFCSESVAICYEAASITLSPREGKTEPQAYTPESIYNDARIDIVFVHIADKDHLF
jgi:hypothetical protein